MLRQLDTALWVNEVAFTLLGINFGNRMTCIQLADNTFWLHSPTCYDQTTHQQIKTKGQINYLVAPNLMHNLFIMDWKAYDAAAHVVAPARAKKVQPDILLETMCDETLDKTHDKTTEQKVIQGVDGEISCIPINGMPALQEYAFVHHASKTLILTDLAFNFGKEVTAWTRLLLMAYGAYNKFSPTFLIRALIKDKDAFSKSLKKIALQDFDRIIISHGRIIESNGKMVFNQAYKKYLEH